MKLLRELLWRMRCSNAAWDVAYYRSGMLYFAQELRKAKARQEQCERERIEVDYPVRGM